MDEYVQETLFPNFDDEGSYEQETPSPAFDGTASLAADTFGCCSSYRACSDAKKCLISEREYSKNCIYRQSLEKGHIFYGKNAASYRADVYQSFVDHYHTLSPEYAELLSDILFYIFVGGKGDRILIPAQSPALSLFEKFGFVRVARNPETIIKRCRYKAMRNACGDSIEKAEQWAKSKTKPEVWEKRGNTNAKFHGVRIQREELAEWIIQFSPEAVSALSGDICFVSLESLSATEIYEFFLDYIYRDDYIPHLNTCENDPRFLKQYYS